MLGIEFHEPFAFLRQVGLALAGAASLWAFVFLRAQKRSQGEKRQALGWAASRLLIAFSAGFGLAALSWFVLWNTWPVLAHEGITLFPSGAESSRAFLMMVPLTLAWIFGTLGVLLLGAWKREMFRKHLSWFYGIQFLVISVLISMYAWTGNVLSNEQIFFYFHGFHSIFTLGTILTLDFLFLSTRLLSGLQRHIFPFFPAISKIIFIGLGLDFLSVFLVFDQVIEFSARFFLAQTVVGILIINGVFMAGPLTRKVLNGLREGTMLGGKWRYIAGISGAVSVISWTTITFIDFFPNMTLSYFQLLAGYVSAVCISMTVNLALAWFDQRRIAFPLIGLSHTKEHGKI